MKFDVTALAHEALRLDRERTKRFPELFARRIDRKSASPLAFLRGSGPLFYELLRRDSSLWEGCGGDGTIVGDVHLENFGAYRPEFGEMAGKKGMSPAFDLNDFDEASRGPLRLDVLRLTTSLLLGGRELGIDGRAALQSCRVLVESYVDALADRGKVPTIPGPVTALVKQVASRSRVELLDRRTRVERGQRRFILGDRYRALAEPVARFVPGAFARYVEGLLPAEQPKPEHVQVIDCAFRVAGTGSLGSLRVAVLVAGKGGKDGAWIFDMKEQGASAVEGLLGRGPAISPAMRVLTAARACLGNPPRLLGTTTLAGRSMLVRRLSPQEDKLVLGQLSPDDVPGLAAYLGFLVGRAHARGTGRRRGKRWTSSDQAVLIGQATTLAGLHEAIYLAYCLNAPSTKSSAPKAR